MVKGKWREFYSLQCFCPLRIKSTITYIKTLPIVLLLTDSHGEQWFNIIIPYAKSNNYVIVHIWFWEDTIINENYVNLFKLFKILTKVNYIVSAHYLQDKYNHTLFSIKYILYLNILLKYCDEIYVIQDTPHFKTNPNLCLVSASDYDNCYNIIGINATVRQFPIHPNRKVHYINMIKYICLNSFKCYSLWNSIPIYMDDNHLTLQFSQTLKQKFLKYIHFNEQINDMKINCNSSYKCGYSHEI